MVTMLRRVARSIVVLGALLCLAGLAVLLWRGGRDWLLAVHVFAVTVGYSAAFAVGLLASYGATQLLIQVVYHQSAGTYRFYFHAFLNPTDLLYAFIKVIVFSVVITMVHCFHGYNARGGPEGVGKAVGRAIRTSIVSVIIIDMLLSLLFWGTSTTVRISG